MVRSHAQHIDFLVTSGELDLVENLILSLNSHMTLGLSVYLSYLETRNIDNSSKSSYRNQMRSTA